VAAGIPSGAEDESGHARPAGRLRKNRVPHLDGGRRHDLDADRHRWSLWASNPETGFSAVAPGTNMKTNPDDETIARKHHLYERGFDHRRPSVWEGGEGDPPADGWDWQGRPWKPNTTDEDGKADSRRPREQRFTAPCPMPVGLLPHRASPRRADFRDHCRRPPARVAPLVYEAFDWEHGVFVSASMASERTAAQFGTIGEVRRDPMAMLPFLRLPHGGLLPTLARDGPTHVSPAKDFPRQLVSHGRTRRVALAGYARPSRDRMDPGSLPRRGGSTKTPIATYPHPRAST